MTISKRPVSVLTFFVLWLCLSGLSGPAQAQNLQQELARTEAQLGFTRLPPAGAPTLLPDEHYVLGPGDALSVEIWNRSLNLHYDLKLNAQGQILIPRIGLIQAQGLTRQQLQVEVKRRAETVQRAQVEVAVLLRQQRQVRVLITGLVRRPGHYQVFWGNSLLDLIRQAGGVLDNGSVRAVELQRGDTQRFDLFDFHYQGQVDANPRLFGGEHIHIPPLKQRVAIVGEVRQAGIYEIQNGESLEDVLLWAGGPKAAADPSQYARWEKGLDRSGEAELRPVSLQAPLHDGDLLYLPARSLQGVKQQIFIRGQVRQPRVLEWRQGLRLLDALHEAGGELPSSDLSQVRISRKIANGQRQDIQVNLQEYLNGNHPDGNPELQAEDTILVPESFFNVRTITDLTTLILSTLGIVSVVVNLVPGP